MNPSILVRLVVVGMCQVYTREVLRTRLDPRVEDVEFWTYLLRPLMLYWRIDTLSLVTLTFLVVSHKHELDTALNMSELKLWVKIFTVSIVQNIHSECCSNSQNCKEYGIWHKLQHCGGTENDREGLNCRWEFKSRNLLQITKIYKIRLHRSTHLYLHYCLSYLQ